MTAPKAPQWPLLKPIRLAALALLCTGVGFLVTGWISALLWVASVVVLLFAVVGFAKVWRGRGTRV
jgi:hypothetical protein